MRGRPRAPGEDGKDFKKGKDKERGSAVEVCEEATKGIGEGFGSEGLWAGGDAGEREQDGGDGDDGRDVISGLPMGDVEAKELILDVVKPGFYLRAFGRDLEQCGDADDGGDGQGGEGDGLGRFLPGEAVDEGVEGEDKVSEESGVQAEEGDGPAGEPCLRIGKRGAGGKG